MKLNVGHATDIGRKRTQNQDTLGSYPELGLFVVADGMGGHKGGETASSMAVEHIHSNVEAEIQSNSECPRKDAIRKAIMAANAQIHDRAVGDAALHGMGTTTTALIFHNNELCVGHVGDSRAYYLRPQAVWQLTRDHSMVQEKLRAGLITRDQMKTDRMKNVITRSVGFELDVNVEVYEMAVQSGDIFLICSDGLSGLLDDQEMLSIVEKHLIKAGNIQKAVEKLIESANEAGGDDNVSVILVQVLGPEGT